MKYIRMLLAVVGLFVAGGAKGAALADDNNPARAFPPGPVIGIYVPFRGSGFNSDAWRKCYAGRPITRYSPDDGEGYIH